MATYRKKDRTAASRVLRLRAPLPRAISIWMRKWPITSASRSAMPRHVGGLPDRAATKRTRSRNVSRYPAIVWRLASICVQSRSVKKRSEEHTSELQSLMRISYAVFCLKKKKQKHTHDKIIKTYADMC